MYANCVICNKICSENNPLSNGLVYHKDCYNNLLKAEKDFNVKLRDYNFRIYSIEKKERNLFSMIKTYLSGDSYFIKKEKFELQQLIKNIENGLGEVTYQLKSLYDYWPDRPPDWEARRKQFIENNPFCEECFSDINDNTILQVHHKIPIFKGGSHKSENLKVLCKSCHQLKHPQNDFESDSHNHVNHYNKKLKTLYDAVNKEQIVSFHYRKWNGEESFRDIKPQGFRLEGKSLCVYGFCYLRQDKRTFAISRITKLKIK